MLKTDQIVSWFRYAGLFSSRSGLITVLFDRDAAICASTSHDSDHFSYLSSGDRDARAILEFQLRVAVRVTSCWRRQIYDGSFTDLNVELPHRFWLLNWDRARLRYFRDLRCDVLRVGDPRDRIPAALSWRSLVSE